MCSFKSGIILKDRIFIPDYDSHIDMLKELNIEDNKNNINFVRAELLPKNNNIFSDVSTWYLNVDQDILPEWFIYDYEEQRMIEAVKEWTKTHVFENVNILELKGKGKYYLKNCKNVKTYDSCEVIAYSNCTIYAYENCIIYARDNCTVDAFNDCVVMARGNCKAYTYDDSTAYVYDSCTANAFNKSTVNAQDKSRVAAHGDCTVNAYDESMVTVYDNCKVCAYNDSIIKFADNKVYNKNLKLFDNAIFINKTTQTIFYQNEDYKFVKMGK